MEKGSVIEVSGSRSADVIALNGGEFSNGG